MIKHYIFSLVIGCTLLGSAHSASPAESRIDCLKTNDQEYFLFNSDMKALITSIAATCDTAATVRLRNTQGVRAGMNSGTPLGLLEDLGREHNFLWHFDGYELHIHPKRTVKSKLLAASEHTPKSLQRRLGELGWLASDESIQNTKDGKILRVNGTQDFVDFVESVLNIQDPDEAGKTVTVYRGSRAQTLTDVVK